MSKLARSSTHHTKGYKMSTFDPVYGELLTAKETSEMTGLTMNQLRNWRLPARYDKAPFGFLYIGTAPYYRRNVILGWLEQNGGSNKRYVPLGIDTDFPIDATFDTDFEKRKAMGEIAQITSETAYGIYYSPIKARDPQGFTTALRERGLYYRSKITGVPVSELEVIVSPQRMEKPDWYVGVVPTLRELYAQQQGYDLTEEEILSAPLGQIPPLKEKNA
jgi:hypothetical protein